MTNKHILEHWKPEIGLGDISQIVALKCVKGIIAGSTISTIFCTELSPVVLLRQGFIMVRVALNAQWMCSYRHWKMTRVMFQSR